MESTKVLLEMVNKRVLELIDVISDHHVPNRPYNLNAKQHILKGLNDCISITNELVKQRNILRDSLEPMGEIYSLQKELDKLKGI